MKWNLSKKLGITVILLSLGLSQVACQSQSSKDDMFNQVGQSQEADKENRQNLKALEDLVGIKDIESIKITLDDWIGGHDSKKNDILVLERTLDIKSKSQVLAFADIFMGVGKKDLKGDEIYKEALSQKEDIVNRLKLSPEKAMINSYIKDIKENKHGYYKNTTIKGCNVIRHMLQK